MITSYHRRHFEALVSINRRYKIYIAALAALLISACASADPEIDNNDNDNNNDPDVIIIDDAGPETGPEIDADSGADTQPDIGADPDAEAPADADADTAPFDPCDECSDDEICTGVECLDPCEEQDRECGTAEWEGEQYDCGDCPAGGCDDGQCPDLCGDFYAECGEIHWNGLAHDCGECSNPPRCMHNQCTANSGFVDLAAGHSHSCATRPDGGVRCWGRNDDGQLGDTNTEDASTPQWVHQLNDVTSLASRNHHTCAVRTDDHVYCWGRNGSYQLGDGSTEHASSPTEATGITATSVATGGSHTCALLQAEKISCWGDNEFGQLGRGTTSNQADESKQRVKVPTGEDFDDVVQISLGAGHTCAIRRDNTLWCWGQNNSGQLGHGDNHDGPRYAERVTAIDDVQQVSTGFHHTCAIRVGGDVLCWGHGSFGTLGDGEASNATSPVEVELPEPAIDIAAGRFHSCAALQSGEVYCWGRNDSGQIAQAPTGGQHNEPMPVADLDDVHRVVSGADHSCALERDGLAYCWGGNEHGQIGDGTESTRVFATSVEQ